MNGEGLWFLKLIIRLKKVSDLLNVKTAIQDLKEHEKLKKHTTTKKSKNKTKNYKFYN